ncbi:Pentalenene oxygenase [Paenibacillus plantiphilus]|uniref:Pentalenene oxygenase n=1 Tax=Paenibacillus plantiphilus TaxID=2905650 RepID=A0ABN8GD54_9BACL|nr:cytochrome P450 [Paenibacillus plantiphilus]CAH1201506.1 Pentalenene oxygenase [Paenibacillus plantiphilus]
MLNETNVRLEPPGPATRSLFGSLNAFRRNPYALMTDAWNEYGDLVRFRFGNVYSYLPVHPEYLKHILQDNHQNYTRGRLYKTFERFFGKGLLTNDGDTWLKNRRLLQPAFRPQSIDSYTQTITESTEIMLQQWDSIAEQQQVVDGHVEMVQLVLRQLGCMVFNHDLSIYSKDIVPAIQSGVASLIQDIGSLNELVPKWVPTPYHRKTRKVKRHLVTIVQRVIDEHKSGKIEGNDVVAMLLKEQAENRLNDQEVFDEVTTIFLAGHDTTAAVFTWILYALSAHPDVRRQLEEEVDLVLGDRVPVMEDVSKLPYTRMAIMEALRLYPPVWGFPRDAIEEDELGQYHIPGGSSMIVSPYMMHRHPEFWDNPEGFNPERFSSGWEKRQHKFAYMPFGHGPRQCVGMNVAMHQLMLSIPMIVRRYQVDLAPNSFVAPANTAILHPHHGLKIRIKRRKP